MKTETVGEMWEAFAQKVLPPGCGPDQREDMRMAFHAGAWLLLAACKALGEPAVPEDHSAAVLDGWEREMTAYWALLAGRRATRH